MTSPSFIFVKTFRIDFLSFDLFKNEDGRYLTICTDLETKAKNGTEYVNFDQLYEVFSDDMSEEDLK